MTEDCNVKLPRVAAAADPLPRMAEIQGRQGRAVVIGLGDPVLDVVCRVKDAAVLRRLGMEAGGCLPVGAQEMAALLVLPEVVADSRRWELPHAPMTCS